MSKFNIFGDVITRKDEKQRAAEARQHERAQRSDRQQLDYLVERGHGFCREARELRDNLGDVHVSPIFQD